jgi:hypothetical protein
MSGKRVVFCTVGSLGDLYPLLALAREMKHRGHLPVVATSPAYRKLIEAEKIAFHPVRPDVDISDPSILRRVMDRRTGGRYLFCDIILPALRDSYEDTAAAAAKAEVTTGGGSTQVRIRMRDYVNPGDSMTMIFDPATKRPVKTEINTFLDDSPASIMIAFDQLRDGPNYPSKIVMSSITKKLEIRVFTYEYRL